MIILSRNFLGIETAGFEPSSMARLNFPSSDKLAKEAEPCYGSFTNYKPNSSTVNGS